MAFLFGSPPIFWVGRLLVSGSVFLIEMSFCLWPECDRLNLVNVICIAVSPTAYQPISHNFLMTCLDQLGISPGTDHPKEILMGAVRVVSKFPHFFRAFPTLSITKTTVFPRKDAVPLCEVIHVSQSRKEFEGKEVPLWKWFGRRWIGPPTMLPVNKNLRSKTEMHPRWTLFFLWKGM